MKGGNARHPETVSPFCAGGWPATDSWTMLTPLSPVRLFVGGFADATPEHLCKLLLPFGTVQRLEITDKGFAHVDLLPKHDKAVDRCRTTVRAFRRSCAALP